jgi:polysaccharide chain length determinant protein (PEP-CTERM system associated)
MNVEGGLQFGDLWSIVLRRAKVVAATALGVALVVTWIALALPNKYVSYATVLVTPQTVAPELVAAGVPESDLNNRLFLMTAEILSRGRMSQIITDLDLYPEKHEYMLREEVIDFMRRQIRVEPVLTQLRLARGAMGRGNADEEINQFRVSFTHRDARTAMLVVKQLSDDFIKQHIEGRIKLSEKSVEFIDDELNRLASRIRLVEARESAIKAKNTGRLPSDSAANQRRLERQLVGLALAQQTFAEASSDEAFYRSQVGNEAAASGTVTPENRLKTLDLLIAEFKAKRYTDKHPDFVKLRMEQIELRAAIERDEAALESNDERELSTAQQRTEAERRRAALRKESAKAEIDRINESIDQVQTLLAETPAVAEALIGLEREYQHLYDSYQDFSDRQLEAAVQAQLERRQLGEKFRVLEAAFVAASHASPNRLVILALGIFFGLAIGFAVGIVLETLDPSVHSARQLQLAVGIPVLAAIPSILLEADLAALRRSRIKVAAATIAIVAFTGVGSSANYVWVNGLPNSIATFFEGEKESVGQPVAVPGTSTETGGDLDIDPGAVIEE